MPYIYEPKVAVDQYGEVLHSGSGQIYAEDGTTLLSVTDLSGVPLSAVTIDGIGLTQAFISDEPEVLWKSGSYVVPLSSPKGMRLATEAAASAAAAAQIAAQAAAGAADAARIAAEEAAALAGQNGGGGVAAGGGNLFVMPVWNGVGAQPARVYPPGHALAGQTIPNAPLVYVKWRQASFPLGVAQEGDEFRRTGG